MFNSLKKSKYINLVCMGILSILIIIALCNISLNSDEIFTMGILHNSFARIINLDSLDVHPPLYYLILKIFLQIVTFWTNNIFIKILLARLLSLIIYLGIVFYGIKLLRLLRMNFHLWMLIIFLTMPSIMLYSLYIRMYILASLFLFMEIYNLIRFRVNDRNIYIYLATFSGILAEYSHYFAAISAGLLLLYCFIISIYQKKYRQSIKYMLSGIIFFVAYIPWIFVARKQFLMATSNVYNTNQIYTRSTYTISNFIHLSEQFVLSLVGGEGTYGNKVIKVLAIPLLLLFIYLIYYSRSHLSVKFNKLLMTSLINLIGTALIGLLVSVFKHPILIDHYLFPSFSILAFLLSYIIYEYFKRSKKFNVVVDVIIFILCINVGLYARFDLQNSAKSFNVSLCMHKWKHTNKRHFFIENSRNNIWVIANDSIYLRSINKRILTNNLKYSQNMFGKSNVSLLKGVYPNVYKRY